MNRASTWLGPRALPLALSRADFRSCMEYCWTCVQAPSGTRGTWRPRTAWKPGRSTGRLSYSSRQKARTANITSWAPVRSFRVLGTRTVQRPAVPGPLPLRLPARLSIAGRCRGRGGARSP